MNTDTARRVLLGMPALGGKGKGLPGLLELCLPGKGSLLSLAEGVLRGYAEPVVGIDLGTTNSCAAVLRNGRPEIVPNEHGKRTTPSAVSFDGGKVLVGERAKKEEIAKHALTVTSSKRLMGKKYLDAEVMEHVKSAGYKIVPHTNGDAWVEVGGKTYSPQQIGAEILRYIKGSVEKSLGEKIRKAVITVPAYFTDAQRKATKTAGEIAGLNVLRVINEPTAAALSYGIDTAKNGTVAVYDLGGGTFDVSILEIKDGIFEVKATNGNNHLGGEDFDAAITQHLVQQLHKKTGYTPEHDPLAMQRIKSAAEKAKCALSSETTTEVSVPFVGSTRTGPVHLSETLTRAELESVISPLIHKTLAPCKIAMADANVRKGEIDHVVVVGGMTRVPSVRKAVEHIFGKAPIAGVDPDEAVATGAAIQGGILSGEMSSLLLIDVAPLSLGIETLGGVFSRVVEKNTTIPAKRSQTFTTSEDGQTSVTIKIYEGERPLVAHNKYLGELVLSDIPPLPKGTPKIEVVFEADANGMYTVTAKDKDTDAVRHISIQPSCGLSREEVDRLVQEAKENERTDQKEKELIEEKQKAKEYVKDHKRLRETFDSSLSPETKHALSSLLHALESLLDAPGTTHDALARAVQALRKRAGQAWVHK
ncbi:molecular chaperone DnaK [Nematocida sp. AWRm77]|nr:molecular chaperone DnaK [Nematocida sp. AWRm77]